MDFFLEEDTVPARFPIVSFVSGNADYESPGHSLLDMYVMHIKKGKTITRT